MIRMSLIVSFVTIVLFSFLFFRNKFNKSTFGINISDIKTIMVFICLAIPYVNIATCVGFILYKASDYFWDLPKYLKRKNKDD